jgi:hypothetical protein
LYEKFWHYILGIWNIDKHRAFMVRLYETLRVWWRSKLRTRVNIGVVAKAACISCATANSGLEGVEISAYRDIGADYHTDFSMEDNLYCYYRW